MTSQPPGFPGIGKTPGRAFLEQLEATSEQIAQRRKEVRALVAQLTAFEQQLAVFEEAIRPVKEWSATWIRAQEQAMDPFGIFGRDNPPRSGPSER